MAPVINLNALVGDKPVWKSWTMRGLALIAVAEVIVAQLCSPELALLSEATCGNLTYWMNGLGGFLVVIGLRKASTAPNTG